MRSEKCKSQLQTNNRHHSQNLPQVFIITCMHQAPHTTCTKYEGTLGKREKPREKHKYAGKFIFIITRISRSVHFIFPNVVCLRVSRLVIHTVRRSHIYNAFSISFTSLCHLLNFIHKICLSIKRSKISCGKWYLVRTCTINLLSQ